MRVDVQCVDSTTWRELGLRAGFEPALTWALTPLEIPPGSASVRPEGSSTLSPSTCRLIGAFSALPVERGARLCRHPAETTTSNRSSTARHARTATRLGECDDWAAKLLAVHALTHESMHLAGVIDEAEADCLATQVDAYVATRLGASVSFAASLAREYWKHYYPSQEAKYRSTRCRNRGALDLFPESDLWPTPPSYPTDLAREIAAFVAAQGASDGAL
jgi:hypothetical protein